jgi:hypothetical protein
VIGKQEEANRHVVAGSAGCCGPQERRTAGLQGNRGEAHADHDELPLIPVGSTREGNCLGDQYRETCGRNGVTATVRVVAVNATHLAVVSEARSRERQERFW